MLFAKSKAAEVFFSQYQVLEGACEKVTSDTSEPVVNEKCWLSALNDLCREFILLI